MSLTVRYQNGRTITYNTANHIVPYQDRWVLYSTDPEKGGTWIASIQASAGVIIEAVPPCNVSAPGDLKEAIKQVNFALETRSINEEGLLLRKTKRPIRRFNSHTFKIK